MIKKTVSPSAVPASSDETGATSIEPQHSKGSIEHRKLTGRLTLGASTILKAMVLAQVARR